MDVCSNRWAKREIGDTAFKWGAGTTGPPLATALSTRCTLLGVSGFLGMRYRDEPYTGELGVFF